MAIEVSGIDELRTYIRGVMVKARGHAPNVAACFLTLVGAVLWARDEGTPIEVRQRNDRMANAVWAHIGGQRYFFSYHHDGHIMMYRDVMGGEHLHTFDNTTSAQEILEIFESLIRAPIANVA
jgi:hypothetical protein